MFRREGKVLLTWVYVKTNTTLVRVWSLLKVNLLVLLLHLRNRGTSVEHMIVHRSIDRMRMMFSRSRIL